MPPFNRSGHGNQRRQNHSRQQGGRQSGGGWRRRDEETGAQRAAGRREEGRGSQRNEQGLRAIPQDNYLVRRIVKPYPNKQGDSFYLMRGARRDRDLLDPKSLEELSDYVHNEWMNGRFGHAASFASGNR